jgi:RimJ/RimL family protein N-acetyltransferase
VKLEPVTLVGTQVTLDPLTAVHVDDLVDAASEDRSTYGLTLVPDEREQMAAYVRAAVDRHAEGQALPFAIRFDGRVVGSTRFEDIADWWGRGVPDAVEIGWTWYAASAQRTAANTEAKLLLLTHAFETWGVRRVTLKTDARNARSRAAIERIGASFEGVRRAHMLAYDGAIRDSAFYSILDTEWPEVEARLVARLT